MIQDLAVANATRSKKLAAEDVDMRRLTASERSGQSYTKGEALRPIADLLPDPAVIDGGQKYLSYDLEDGRQLSYKALFGKKVYAPKGVETEATPYTVTENGETKPFVLVKREDVVPRCTKTLAVHDKPTDDGKLVHTFDDGQFVTVADILEEAYVVRRPSEVAAHPAGKYYAVAQKDYAIFG